MDLIFNLKYYFRKQFWNFHSHTWNEYLDASKYADEIREFVKITDRFKNIDKPTLLDIGCATGNYSIEFAKAGYMVTGIDYSKKMLKKSKAEATNCGLTNIKFINADFNEPFNLQTNFYDFIIAAHVTQGVVCNAFFIAEIIKAIKKGGHLILIVKGDKKKMKVFPVKLSLLARITSFIKRRIFSKTFTGNNDSDVLIKDLISAGFVLQASESTVHNYVYSFRC